MRWRPTYAEIDLDAIRSNCRALRALLGPQVVHLQVVKANGYGHGDVEVARACLESGVQRLAVALVEEGVRLREAGIDVPVLVLIEAPPDAAGEIVSRGLTPSVSTRAGAESIAKAASDAGSVHPVHVAVDTGMHREGVSLEEAAGLIGWVREERSLSLEGVWSHLASPDDPAAESTGLQIGRFAQLRRALESQNLRAPLFHLANSAATIARPEAHHDMVRTGVACYGLLPAPWMADKVTLRPAMRLVSSVGLSRRVPAGEGVSYGLTWAPEKETTIATVQLGYADGFARLLSNSGEVLIGGVRRPVVGRVTMDTIMVDCGDDAVSAGDEAVLMGSQGADAITADEIAGRLQTIHYEVVCGVGARVPRVYLG
ncbi:MAG TPA: alanine racemase [Actinomycetota bacterium]|nr:alanine racemase [Actinomycetota bacterium]